MPREFVIGDIHGAHKALRQVFELAEFDKKNDTLFCLGDLVDGWPESKEVIEELMTLDKLQLVLGNHDLFFLDWIHSGEASEEWLTHGGRATLESFSDFPSQSIIEFLESSEHYILDRNRLFVHGGIKPDEPLLQQDSSHFLWDRSLYQEAWNRRDKGRNTPITEFNEVFIGHTPIHRQGHLTPQKVCEVWMMDTGAGWEGVLSLMDLSSYEVYTSSTVKSLYPNHKGR